jgi:hypothetical protein
MEELRKLIAKWRRQALNRVSLASLSKRTDLDICADELEAYLPAVERELEDMKQRLANFEREGPLTPTGVELLERGVLMGLEAARKLIAENADIVEIVKDAEAKGG